MNQVLSGDAVSDPTCFEKLCKRGVSTRGLISEIYSLLVNQVSLFQTKHTYMLRWESYLGAPLDPQTWQLIWRRASKSSSCIAYKEN